MTHPEEPSISSIVKQQIGILATFVIIFWAIEIINVSGLSCLVGNTGAVGRCATRLIGSCNLIRFGIIPHNLIGLRGVLLAPFIHGGFPHLIANTIPFIVLGWLVMLQETRDFWIVTAFTMVVGGLGTWVFGMPCSFHIGASILIYGYLGFLLFRGYYERNFMSILLSIVVFSLYGGVIWGVLPTQPGVSWQGHLFGLIGGILAAKYIGKARRALND
ncbi:rhomboid family intramembrane serine protease [Spirulina subsalsa FACHB-351]|uniref:Rhomboid family intramembrane serine protease n=1 Tax=Spirulina subsalsa FACHB-351 TaxID=234711 RepID=A0ABT3L228_9CYAN|nr:rhomboid family intramembrane serine protease [Spirulina subsalsa]MCW6035507.1 rhomboid family intramembrane serine protease [Spirulina subsalsa FACHB-351]